MNKPSEYLCQIDSGVVPIINTTWALRAPNTTYWNPSVNTVGIISVIDTNTAANTYPIAGMDGIQWDPTISNAGIVTITSSINPVLSSTNVPALLDSNARTWLLMTRLDGQLVITDENPFENKYYYPAIIISFIVGAETDTLELHAVKPNTIRHRR
jgi:hypothetical protein